MFSIEFGLYKLRGEKRLALQPIYRLKKANARGKENNLVKQKEISKTFWIIDDKLGSNRYKIAHFHFTHLYLPGSSGGQESEWAPTAPDSKPHS